MKKTPLYDEHVKLGARMVPFGGWDMPVQYAGILKEHEHTRTKASVFDICHMGEFELSGPTAAADLEKLLTQSVASLAIGQCRYGFMLNEEGGVIDDLTCYRLAEDRFYLVVNAATAENDAAWIRDRISATTDFADVSEETAKLDVQGPGARQALEEVFGPLPELKYFRIEEVELLGVKCLLSRTGYTGELGYEIYFPATEAARFWNALLENPGIEPGGLGARDTLRLEMGYSLYGHELSAEHSPVATGGGMFIKKDLPFIGCETVQRELADGPARRLVALQLETKRAAREEDAVYCDGELVGEVSSGSVSPSLGVAVALAFVRADVAGNENFELEVRGKKLSAKRVTLPFYKNGTARC
ncbi:glycine cleavage system aminomethyltransferase GcvT [Verrucomicrobiota bacterium]